MPKYVAFLRGINVGGNNKIPMKDLKSAFDELGLTNVQTYINSGNVIFGANSHPHTTKQLEKLIEDKINAKFGFKTDVMVRSSHSIFLICKEVPSTWLEDEIHRTYVMFLSNTFDSPESINLLNINHDVDKVRYIKGALVWHMYKLDYAKSGMKNLIGTKLYKNMTARNINTVRKLSEMLKN
jgi:uncharacterized protein (DUF1697 family)